MRASLVALLVLSCVASGRADTHHVSQSGFGAYEASLTRMGSGFAAAWYDTRHGHAEIYARMLDARGVPAGPERRLTIGTADAYEPDIAAAGNLLIVAWYEHDGTKGYRAMLGAWTKDGVEQWRTRLSGAAHGGKNGLVRVRGNDVFCAWIEQAPDRRPEVRAQWYSTDGRPRSAAMSIGPAGRTTWNVRAALDDRGLAWVAFDAAAGTRADEVFLARVARESHTLTRLTADDGKASKYPDIAVRGNHAAVSWHDVRDGNEEVYLLVAPAGSVNGEIDARAARVTRTAGESIGAYVAWNGNRVGLAWCDNTGGQHEIYFAAFDSNGRSTASARRLTDTRPDSLIPAILPAGRGFALAWNEFTPGPGGGHDIRGRSDIVFSLVP